MGLPFLIAEARGRRVLERARVNLNELSEFQAEGLCDCLHIYTNSNDEYDTRPRVNIRKPEPSLLFAGTI